MDRNSKPEKPSRPKILFWSSSTKSTNLPFCGCPGRGSNPIGAKYQVLVEFPKIDLTARFCLPGRGNIKLKPATPWGPKITFWSNFLKSAQLPLFGYQGRGDKSSRPETPSKPKLTFQSNFSTSTQLSFSGCPGGGDTYSEPGNPWGRKSRFGLIPKSTQPPISFYPRRFDYVLDASNPIAVENRALVEFPEIEPTAMGIRTRSVQPQGPNITFLSSFSISTPRLVSGGPLVGIRTRRQQPHGGQKSRFGRIFRNRLSRRFLSTQDVAIRITSQ